MLQQQMRHDGHHGNVRQHAAQGRDVAASAVEGFVCRQREQAEWLIAMFMYVCWLFVEHVTSAWPLVCDRYAKIFQFFDPIV